MWTVQEGWMAVVLADVPGPALFFEQDVFLGFSHYQQRTIAVYVRAFFCKFSWKYCFFRRNSLLPEFLVVCCFITTDLVIKTFCNSVQPSAYNNPCIPPRFQTLESGFSPGEPRSSNRRMCQSTRIHQAGHYLFPVAFFATWGPFAWDASSSADGIFFVVLSSAPMLPLWQAGFQ